MKCPTCKKQGKKVGNETVGSRLKPTYRKQMQDYDHYLCMNADCNIAYYSSNSIFEKSALNVPLWYKKNAAPKYACYCRKITEEEVTKAVKETGLSDIDDIMLHLRGEVRSNCKINNPTGHCCHPVFSEMIEKALGSK